MTTMTDENTLAILDKAKELSDCLSDIDNVTDFAYAEGTVSVAAADTDAAKTRSNTARADLKTLVDDLTDFV